MPCKKTTPVPEQSSAEHLELEAQARQAIYAFHFPSLGKNVAELIAELNVLLRDESIDTIQAITRSGELKAALYCVGLMAISAHPDLKLTVDLYGLVTDEKKLLKVLPELKPCMSVLPGLTL
nr:hypothetical protein [uncultured Pseudogulbenkiania sp.]